VVAKTPEPVAKTVPHPIAFKYSDDRQSFYPGLTGATAMVKTPEVVVKKEIIRKETVVKKKESVVKTPGVFGKKFE
jgi:hypothetical protein